MYEHCIDNDHSTLWCAIETNSNGTYSKWKNCDENCSKNSYEKQDHNSFELYNIVNCKSLLGSIEHPTNIKWTYDIMLPFEKNIATEITIIDDNLLPTGYYELTFDFFSVSIFPADFPALPLIYAVYKSAKNKQFAQPSN